MGTVISLSGYIIRKNWNELRQLHLCDEAEEQITKFANLGCALAGILVTLVHLLKYFLQSIC